MFISEGFYEDKLMKKILVTAGEKRLEAAKLKFKRPYSLEREGIADDEIFLLDVVRGFLKEIADQEKFYAPIWNAHLYKNTGFSYAYASKMATVIEEEVKHHLPRLDLDGEYYELVVDLIRDLEKFDKFSHHNTLSAIKPKIDAWIQKKLVKIRDVVERCLTFERWERAEGAAKK